MWLFSCEEDEGGLESCVDSVWLILRLGFWTWSVDGSTRWTVLSVGGDGSMSFEYESVVWFGEELR